MLKIKDNVDLKELEKFGFKNEEHHCYCKECSFLSCIIVPYKERNININQEDDEHIVADTIYDLIKADLVEKVEEK